MERLTGWIKALLTHLNVWLAGLPSTNFQVLVSATMAWSSAVIYYVTVLRSIPVDSVNFGLWLSFVAAYGGIAYRQFAKKRDTQHKPDQAKQNQEPT